MFRLVSFAISFGLFSLRPPTFAQEESMPEPTTSETEPAVNYNHCTTRRFQHKTFQHEGVWFVFFLDRGIVSTGATDYVPGPYEPLTGIQSCVTRTDRSGKVWGPDQKITPEEALRLYTLHGAYASFEERIKGSIEVGKLADLVVLGADPTAVDPHTIKEIPVERTIVGGEVVHES